MKVARSLILFFIIGIILGAAITIKYYEDEGCVRICSQKLEFGDRPAYPIWNGEEQYRRV